MNEIDTNILTACRAERTREACGIVSTQGYVYPVRNVSSLADDFVFSKSDYYTALGAMKASGDSIKAIYHSHLNGNRDLSPADIVTMERFKCDFVLVVGGTVRWFDYE